MTPVLTIGCSAMRTLRPAYDWRSDAALPPTLRIEVAWRCDEPCFFLPPRAAESGVSFSIFRIGVWSRYVLCSGAERLRKLCITVAARFRKLVRTVRRLKFAGFPATARAAMPSRGRTVLRL